MNFKTAALLVMCIIVISAAGCLGNNGQPAPKSQDLTHGAVVNSQAVYTSDSGSGPVPVPTSLNTGGTTIDTKIIKTADLTVEVNDVTGSVDALRTLAVQKGGYISSTNLQKDSNNQLTGMVVLRIPAAEFDSTLAGAKALGTVKSVSTEGQDVTEQYVDVQAQITSYQNQIAQYNAILKQSQNVEDILKVQVQIDQVQTELDRLNGRMKYLNSQIDFSTITVNLQQPEPVGGQGGHDFVAAINDGIAGFLGMIDAIIIIVISIIPLVIIGGAGYGIYRWWKGKKKPQP